MPIFADRCAGYSYRPETSGGRRRRDSGAVGGIGGAAGGTVASTDVSTQMLATLRRNEPESPTRFAVGFTSAMAGVLLATETVKTLLSQPMAPESPEANNATFQFLKPTATVNAAGRLAPDPRCPACVSTNPATAIWHQRIDQLHAIIDHG